MRHFVITGICRKGRGSFEIRWKSSIASRNVENEHETTCTRHRALVPESSGSYCAGEQPPPFAPSLFLFSLAPRAPSFPYRRHGPSIDPRSQWRHLVSCPTFTNLADRRPSQGCISRVPPRPLFLRESWSRTSVLWLAIFLHLGGHSVLWGADTIVSRLDFVRGFRFDRYVPGNLLNINALRLGDCFGVSCHRIDHYKRIIFVLVGGEGMLDFVIRGPSYLQHLIIYTLYFIVFVFVWNWRDYLQFLLEFVGKTQWIFLLSNLSFVRFLFTGVMYFLLVNKNTRILLER